MMKSVNGLSNVKCMTIRTKFCSPLHIVHMNMCMKFKNICFVIAEVIHTIHYYGIPYLKV